MKRLKWQSHFEDYRALAEGMRVQLYWAIAAVPAAVSDHYLRKQYGELGWIQFALRGPALWGAALANTLGQPRRMTVLRGWITHQALYFRDKTPLFAEAEERGAIATRCDHQRRSSWCPCSCLSRPPVATRPGRGIPRELSRSGE